MSDIKIDHGRPRGRGDAPRGVSDKGKKQRARLDGQSGAKKKAKAAVVKITSYTKTTHQVWRHVQYLMQDHKAKDGPELVMDSGEVYKGKGAVEAFMGEMREAITPRAPIVATASMVALAERIAAERGIELPSRIRNDRVAAQAVIDGAKIEDAPKANARRTMNMVLSLPANEGTGPIMKAMAEQFGENAFVGRRWGFVVHTDKGHIHAHFVVGVRGDDGKQLSVGRSELGAWRELAARVGANHGLALEARSGGDPGRRKPFQDRETVDLKSRALIASVVTASIAASVGVERVERAVRITQRDNATAKIRPTASQTKILDRLAAQGVQAPSEAYATRRGAAAWLDATLAPSAAVATAVARELGRTAPAQHEGDAQYSGASARARRVLAHIRDDLDRSDGTMTATTRTFVKELATQSGRPAVVGREDARDLVAERLPGLLARAREGGDRER